MRRRGTTAYRMRRFLSVDGETQGSVCKFPSLVVSQTTSVKIRRTNESQCIVVFAQCLDGKRRNAIRNWLEYRPSDWINRLNAENESGRVRPEDWFATYRTCFQAPQFSHSPHVELPRGLQWKIGLQIWFAADVSNHIKGHEELHPNVTERKASNTHACRTESPKEKKGHSPWWGRTFVGVNPQPHRICQPGPC